MRVFLLSLFISILYVITNNAFAQPAWETGYPSLRSEVRSMGLRVKLNQKSTVYYLVYRISGTEPSSGSLTAAQIKNAGTAPAGFSASGSFTFGDASYCRLTPPICSNTDGDISIERVVSVNLSVFGNYRVFFTSESIATPGSLTAPVDRSSLILGADRCIRVGETSVPPSKSIGLAPLNVCSPSSIILTIQYTGVDYSAASTVAASVNFGDDGTAYTSVALDLQNAVGLGTPELNKAFRVYKKDILKVYDYALGDDPGLNPSGSGCTFRIDADLGTCRLTGVATDLNTAHTVWDDPGNAGNVRGAQDVEPNGPDAADEEFEVCEQDRSAVNLVDNSVFNCTTVEETRQAVPLPASPNYEARWVQWVYGATGTNVTTGAASDQKVTINGVDFDLSDFPIYGPVEYMQANIEDPWSTAYPIQMPTTATTGQVFVVQMRSWNTCRAYDSNVGDGGLNPIGGTFDVGDNNDAKWFSATDVYNDPGAGVAFPDASESPIVFDKEIVIIDTPDPPIVADRDVCNTTNASTADQLSVTAPLGAGFTYRWWSNSTLTTQVGAGTTFNPDNTLAPNGQRTHFWVTVESTATGTCRSQPTEVRLIKRSQLAQPPSISVVGIASNPDDLCPNTTYTFTVTTAPANITITDATADPDVGLATDYIWSVPTGWTIDGGQGTETITATSRSTAAAAANISVVRQYETGTSTPPAAVFCPSTARTKSVTVRARPTSIISPDPALVCETSSLQLNGNPTLAFGTITNHTWTVDNTILDNAIIQQPTVEVGTAPGTYNLTYTVTAEFDPGVSCSGSDDIVVTVRPTPVKPTITPSGATTFCDGGSVTLTASNADGNAASYRWYRGGVNTGVTTASIVVDAPGESGSYTVEAVGIGTTFCTSELSDATVVTVHVLPTASVSGGGSACSGNPAADVVFTFTGAGPFDLVYAIDGTNQPIENNVTSPFSISAPADGLYTIVSVTDSNTPNCAVTAPNGNITGSATVTTQVIAPPAIESFTVSAAVCDDGGTTNPPDATLNLSPDAVANYNITYRIRRISNNALSGLFSLNNVATNALGEIVISPSYADLGNAPDVQGYRIELASIINVVTLCSGNPGNSDVLIVNPRPAAPTSNGDVLVCSDVISTATVSVVNPGAGFAIDWYDAPTAGVQLLAGNNVLDPAGADEPTPGTTETYYAEIRNTVTGCVSSSRTEVDLTSDARPANPTVGVNQITCSDAAVLSGNAATNGGTGTWTTGSAIYNQTFSSAEENVGVNGTTAGSPVTFVRPDWSLTINPALYAGSDPNDYFKVSGGVFSGRDLANTTMVWESRAIDITAFSTVRLSVDLAEFGAHTGADFVRATYTINGGAPQLIGEIVGNGTDGVFQRFTATTAPAGTSLKIFVSVRNDGNTDRHDFDNVQVFATTTTALPIIADVNNPTSAVTNLQDGVNTFTWTINSALAACTLPPAVLTITKNPQPITQDITFDLCETIEGDSEHLNYNLTVHDAAVANNEANRTVTWFLNAALTNPVPDATDVTVGDTDIFYARVENTLTNCTNLAPILNAGSVTFTVNPLPVANDQDATNAETVYCEEFPVASGIANDVDLTILEDNITGGVANRSVTWFESDMTTLVGSPGDIDAVIDGRIFFARVTNTLTNCQNFAEVEITVNPLPLDNLIETPSGSTPASYTVCAGTSILLFQVDPTLNPGSTYTWSIPTGGGQFELFGGGGVNDFFVLLRFPTSVPGGLPITVTETSADGCDGNVNTLTIIVDSAPAAPVIQGDNNVCANEQNVNYSITSPVGGSTYTWTVPGTLGAIVSGQGSSAIVLNMSNTSGNITVLETNVTGCVSPPAAPFNVTVNPRPSITSPAALTICSGEAVNPSLTLTGSLVGTVFDWVVTAKIGPVGGAAVGNSGTGQISHTLTNTSASIGQIIYDITPKIDIDPTAAVEFCNGPTQTVTIEVYPEPVGINQAITICSDVALNYDLQADNVDALGNGLPALFTYTVISSDPINVPAEANRAAASNLPITHTYTNITTANVTVTYTILPVYDDPEACAGDPFTLTVTVRPEPVGVVDTDIICGSSSVAYDLIANIASGNNLVTGTTFSWVAADNPDVTGESLAPQTGNTISDIITNVTTGNEVVVYTVTPFSAASCSGNPFTVTITVQPTPVGANNSITRCSDEAIGLTLSTNPAAVAAATYTIAVNSNGLTQSAGADSNGPGKLANEIADDEWLNNGLNPVNVIYTVTPVSAAGCSGVSFTITVQVNPEPIVNSSAATRCSDDAVNVTLTSSLAAVAASTYNVSVNANGLLLAAGTDSNGNGKAANELADDIWRNTGLAPVNVIYTITPVSAAGCEGDDFTVTITVNPEPVGSNSTAEVCSDAVLGINLTTLGTSVAATTYNIVVNPNGLIQSSGTGSAGNGKLSTEIADDAWRNIGLIPVDVTYTITPISAAGCFGNNFTVTVTVNPEPVGNNSAATVCSDSPVGVTLTTLGTAVPAATYNISVNTNGLVLSNGTDSNGNGKLANELADDEWTNTGLAPVNVIYTIIPVSAAPESCLGDSFTVTVTINPEPVGTSSAALRCSDQAVGITLSTNVAAVAATSYNISVNNGGLVLASGTDSNGNGRAASELSDDVWTNTGLVPVDVIYTIRPVSAAGCVGNPFTVTITINPEPVGANSTATRCSDEVININLTTNGASVAADTYTIAVNPNGLLQSAGTASTGALKLANELADDVWRNTGLLPVDVVYTIIPVSADGCSGNSFTITVTINPEPVGANSSSAVCSDAAVATNITTSGFAVAAAAYNIVVTDNGLVQIGGTVSGGNGKAANEIADDIWHNAGSTAVNVVYTITPVSADLCQGNSFTITVTVNPEPVLSTTLDDAVCSDAIVDLVLNTNGASVAAASYNITDRVVAVGLVPVSQVTVPTNGVAANYLRNEIYRNTTNGPLTVTYDVVPVGTIGSCLGDEETVTITINPEPVVAATLNANVCSDVSVGLVLSVAGTSVPALDYNIVNRIVAPGLTPVNQVVLANNVAANYLQGEIYRNTTNGALTVQYIVEATGTISGCVGDQRTIIITIDPEPVVSTSLDASRCSDAIVGLVLNTNGTSIGALNYDIISRTIEPGLTPVSQVAVPFNTVAATYLQNEIYRNTTNGSLTVEYVVVARGTINGCVGDQRIITITIDPEPIVSATLNNPVCSDNIVNLVLDTAPGSVAATNYNIVSRTVSGGLTPVSQVIVPANSVSTTYLQNEVYRNTTNGSLTVTYEVRAVGSINGCSSDIRTITINVDPEPVVSTTLDATVCSDAVVGLVLNTNGTSVLAASYNIVSRTVAPGLVPVAQVFVPFNAVGDTYLQTEQYTNTTNGPLTVQYVVEARGTINNCLGDQRTITITIDPEPVISPSLNGTVCSDATVGLVLNTNGSSVTALSYDVLTRFVGAGLTPVTQVAIPGNGVGSTYLQNEEYTNLTNAPIDVVYTVRATGTVNGCVGDNRIITITIDPEPVIATTLDDAVCSDQVIGLVLNTNGTSIGAANYNIISRTVTPGLIPVSQVPVPATGITDTYLQNEVYRNTTSTSLSVTYLVAARGTVNSCLGNQQTITITIDPEPVIATTLNDNVCSGEIVGLLLNTNGSSIGAANYNIISRTVAPGLNPITQVAIAPGVVASYLQNEVYENTTNTSHTVEYVVEAVGTINGCVGDQRTIIISIDPQPVISPSLDASVCSDNAVNLVMNTNGTSIGALNYNILSRTVGAGLIPVTQVPLANGVSATYLQGEVYRNLTAGSLTVEYEVQARGSISSCLGDPLIVTITIDPEPVFAALATLNGTPVCSDDVVGLVLATNGTSIGAANYNLLNTIVAGGLSPVTQVASPQNGVPANYVQNEVYTNTTNGSLTVQYVVVPVGTINACLGDQLTIVKTIAPEPVVSTFLDDAICSDDAVGLVLNTNGTSIGALNYNVISRTVDGGLTPISEAASPAAGVNTVHFQSDIYRNTGNTPLDVVYVVEAVGTLNSCVGDQRTITITINPEPVMPLQDIAGICSDLPINLVLVTNGTSVAASIYNIQSITVPGGLTANGANVPVPLNGVADNYLQAHRFNNVGPVQIDVEYRVEPISAVGCAGDFIDITVGIDPEPVVDAGLDETVCSDLPYGNLLDTNGTSIGAATYDVSAVVEAGLLGAASTGLTQPNTLLQNDAFTNLTSAQLKVTYTVIPNGTNGCIGDARAIEFKINPEPVIDVTAPDPICSNNTNQPDQTEIVLSTNGTSVNAVSYRLLNVEYSDGGPFSVAVPAGFNPNAGNRTINAVSGINIVRTDKFNNISLNAVVVRYTLEPIGPTVGPHTCVGDSETVEITVNPEPEIDPSISPTAVCSDVPAGASAELSESGSSVAIASYIIKTILFPDLTAGTGNTGIGANKPFNTLVNDSYTNVAEVQKTATYTIAPVSVAGCTGLDDLIVLTIDPAPNLANNLNRIVCNDAVAGITLSVSTTVDANGGFDILDIDSNGGQNNLVANAGNAVVANARPANALAADRFVNGSTTTDTVRYGIKPVSAAGCKGPREVVTLVIEPPIQMNAGSTLEICSNGSTNFTLTSGTSPSAGPITFNYAANSTSPQTTGFSIFQNSLPNPHTIVDVLTNNANAAHTVTYTVTPRAESAANGVGCLGTTSQFVARVQPKPKLVPVPASFTVCEGVPIGVDLTTASTPTDGAAVPIPVSFSLLRVEEESGSTPDSVSGFETVLPRVYNPGADVLNEVLTNIDTLQRVIRYFFEPRFDILSGTCLGDETSVLVTVNPRAQIVGLTDEEVCSGEEFTQNIEVEGAEEASTLITWTRTTPPPTGITGSSNGAGNIITQVLFNNNNVTGAITYTFTPTSFNCVGPTASFVSTVLPTPKLVGLASSFEICDDADFEVDLDSFSPTANATFSWSVDNIDPLLLGSTGGNGLAIDDTWSNATGALATATYTITPIVEKTDGTDCVGPEKIVSVNIAPEVGATLFSSTGDNDDFLCEGGKGFVFFENTGLPSFDLTYSVNDGSTINNITLIKQGSIKLLEVQPLVTTTYTVLSVKDAFGCEFIPTTDNVVTVNVGNTDATFNIVGDAINCSPFPVDFQYNQQDGVVYNWKWFDGEPDSTYTATAGVTGQVVTHSFFNPAPGATVKYKVFLETSFPDAVDPDDNYPGACFKTSFKEVQVYPTVATAVFPDKTEICSGEEVRFVNTSQGVRSDKFFYRVQGSTGELEPRTGAYTPPQRPATSTIYTLENLTVANPLVLEVVYQSSNLNCPAADVVIPITVYRGVTADFTTTAPTLFVGGHSFVNVTNTTNPIDALAFNYEWTFGLDATPADFVGTTPTNPIDYVTPGLKEITLSVSNRLAAINGLVCSDFITKAIDIEVPPLTADFVATPLAACFPTDVTVIENLATGDVFAWTVIDDRGRVSATSNANLPVFAIPNPGKYTIILSTSNSFTGDEVTELKELEIFESPLASFEVRPTVVFIPDQEITTFNFSTDANQYDWDFGDGNTSIDFEPKITYRVEGDYPITLVAGFNHGDRDIDGDGVLDGAIICYDTLTRTVQAKDGGLTRVPNSFTPSPNGPNGGNGGGGSFNDVFLPITKGVEEFMMQVFDRWGNLVFESRDKNQGWDGYNRNGILMPAGVYVYKLELRLSNGERTTQVGDITLIR